MGKFIKNGTIQLLIYKLYGEDRATTSVRILEAAKAAP